MDVENGAGGTAQPSSGAGAGQQTGASEGSVPKGLERFAGQDGKVDSNKLGASYLELEKGFHQINQKFSTLDKAYQALAGKVEAPAVDPEEARGREFERFTSDPKSYTEQVAAQALAKGATPIMNALLTMTHPELKDPKFREGLDEFAASLPPALQGSLGDFQHANWVIQLYKEKMGTGVQAPAGTPLPHTESPSASHASEGKTYKRSEIKKLMYENPDEYTARADEFAAAYREGRVKEE